MMSALIIITLAAVFYSLWIRRDTWRSRWEADASLNIALQGCAVLLMSPWASETLGPPLHHIFRRWNVEDLLGQGGVVQGKPEGTAAAKRALSKLRRRVCGELHTRASR